MNELSQLLCIYPLSELTPGSRPWENPTDKTGISLIADPFEPHYDGPTSSNRLFRLSTTVNIDKIPAGSGIINRLTCISKVIITVRINGRQVVIGDEIYPATIRLGSFLNKNQLIVSHETPYPPAI